MFGPLRMSALSQTGLFIPLLLFFWLSRSNEKPTDARDLKSNFMPAERCRDVFILICESKVKLNGQFCSTLLWVLSKPRTFSRGQDCIQPLVQSVVTIDIRRVGHDRDRLLTRCSITFQSDISLQDHDITWRVRRSMCYHFNSNKFILTTYKLQGQTTPSVKNAFFPFVRIDVFVFTWESFVHFHLAVGSVKPGSQ